MEPENIPIEEVKTGNEKRGLRIELIEHKKLPSSMVKLRFGWQGNISGRDLSWFLCVKNGEPEPVLLPLIISHILQRAVTVPVKTESRIWIRVCSQTGWIITQSNQVVVSVEPRTVKTTILDIRAKIRAFFNAL